MWRDSAGTGDLHWRGSLAVAALSAFLALFEAVRQGRTDLFDRSLTARVQRYRAPWLSRTFTAVSWLGFPPQSHVVPPLLAAALWLGGMRRDARWQLVAWSASLLATLTKGQMHRPRPSRSAVRVARGAVDGTSFPSGHVLSYVVVFGYFAASVVRSGLPAPLRLLCAIALGGLIALVGPSRVYLGHHWATDTIASYLLGTAYLLLLRGLGRTIPARRTGR